MIGVGDRLDTDILAGIQSELKSVLVLTGVCSIQDIQTCAYRPEAILPSLGSILIDGSEVDEVVSEFFTKQYYFGLYLYLIDFYDNYIG